MLSPSTTTRRQKMHTKKGSSSIRTEMERNLH
jgi:hypothetical protein